ncbi:MAG: hypothetical protein HXX19_01125 [Rhodoferax sp.]|nr:hypothetical protein [Rhodoferax sp.]
MRPVTAPAARLDGPAACLPPPDAGLAAGPMLCRYWRWYRSSHQRALRSGCPQSARCSGPH